MAPLPVIADVNRVVLGWTCSGLTSQNAVNVLHFSAPGKTPAEIFTAFDTNVTAAMWGPVSNTARVQSVDITPLDGSSATLGFVPANVAKWTGLTTGDPIPNSCGLVKLETALRGRSYRGRIYLPDISESATAVGAFTSTLVTNTTNAWVTFANAMATAGIALGVASYKLSTWHQVLNLALEETMATQRRRLQR